ncbi:MAG: hypothetical protein KA760_14540 [Steroidobacteraceae bacterium]|nr:hypothetical protein [Steroidobacteraceae bacterium]
MEILAREITECRRTTGKLPPTIREMISTMRLSKEYVVDGWERPFYYYRTGPHFVLVSFGSDGQPIQQRSAPPRFYTDADDPADDFVVVDGHWAQVPRAVQVTERFE